MEYGGFLAFVFTKGIVFEAFLLVLFQTIHLRMVASFFICGRGKVANACRQRDRGTGDGRYDLIDCSLLSRAKKVRWMATARIRNGTQ